MAIKRVKYKGRDITCPHGNVLAEIDGRVCWVSPTEAKRQAGKTPPKKPTPGDQGDDPGDDQGDDPGDDPSEPDENQGSFWGGK